MKSLNIGKWFGVEIDFHWSTLILIYIAAQSVMGILAQRNPGLDSWIYIFGGVVVGVGVVLSVLAHELAHAIVGIKLGMRFLGITIMALGGLARMGDNVKSAKQEFLMAGAGPALSVVLGIVLVFTAIAISIFVPPVLNGMLVSIVLIMGQINIVLGLFNGLIPAFPLDAGRLLRATVWAITKNFRAATKVAGWTGMLGGAGFILIGVLMSFGISIPFFGVGLSGGIWIAIIGGLIVMAAKAEVDRLNK